MSDSYDDYEHEHSRRYQAQFTTCKYCGQDELIWINNELGKWVLVDENEELHKCKGANMICTSVAGMNAEPERAIFLKNLMSTFTNGNSVPISITIQRDYNNPYDKNAIEVILNGYKIGYVPKRDQMYFDFTKVKEYTASIVSWGIIADGAVYLNLTFSPVPDEVVNG